MRDENWQRLGSFFGGWFVRSDLEHRIIARKLIQQGASPWSHWDEAKIVHWLERFERGEIKRPAPIGKPQIPNLADSYGFPVYLADPFLVPGEPTAACGSYRAVPAGNPSPPGVGIRAIIPGQRLDKSDASIVFVQLAPNGYTEPHEHPGDELVFVIEGELELCFEHTGVRTRLSAGDYIVFYAERLHYGRNPSTKDTLVLVLRFFQFRSPSWRSVIRASRRNEGGQYPEAWRRILNDSEHRIMLEDEITWLVSLDRLGACRIPPETIDAVASQADHRPREVLDRFGLARLLRRVAASEGWKPADLARNAAGVRMPQEFKERLTRDLVADLHHGRPCGIKEDDLDSLAQVYHVSAMLLFDYLFPAERGAIVVRRGELVPMKSSLLPDGVEYGIPPRRLAISDIAAFQLAMPGSGRTHENHHPGTELCVALHGQITVTIEGEKDPIKVQHGQYVHFDSSKRHQVEGKNAEAFVVRFYEADV